MKIEDATTQDLIRALQEREKVAMYRIEASEPTVFKIAGPVLLIQTYFDQGTLEPHQPSPDA